AWREGGGAARRASSSTEAVSREGLGHQARSRLASSKSGTQWPQFNRKLVSSWEGAALMHRNRLSVVEQLRQSLLQDAGEAIEGILRGRPNAGNLVNKEIGCQD